MSVIMVINYSQIICSYLVTRSGRNDSMIFKSAKILPKLNKEGKTSAPLLLLL